MGHGSPVDGKGARHDLSNAGVEHLAETSSVQMPQQDLNNNKEILSQHDLNNNKEILSQQYLNKSKEILVITSC